MCSSDLELFVSALDVDETLAQLLASEGFATVEEVLRIAPRTKIVIATGNGARKNALKAVGIGAYDFCEKTVEIDVLRTIVDRALNLYRLEEENRQLRSYKQFAEHRILRSEHE